MTESRLSALFELAQNGNREAENELAEVLWPVAIRSAKRKLAAAPSPLVDHEDLAVSALQSVLNSIREGGIEFKGDKLLEALLKVVVARKAAQYWRSEHTQKRNRGQVIGENDLQSNDSNQQFGEIVGANPESIFINNESVVLSPSEAKYFHSIAETLGIELDGIFKELFNKLDPEKDKKMRRMLLLMMNHDLSNEQMAQELSCAIASVERYRASIRRKITRIVDGSSQQ